MGCRTKGNPIKGFPAGRSPAKTHPQTITAPARRSSKRFDSLARFHFDLFNAENPTGPLTPPHSLSRGHRSPTRDTRPRRHGSGDTPPLARFYALDKLAVRHAAISLKLRPRGHPRAACGPPFLLFGLRPRRNGIRVSPSAEGEEGSALHLPAF